MYGLHTEMGIKGLIFSLILEFIFLGICAVFIGLGVSELKRHKNQFRNISLIVFGLCLAGVSLYVTKLLIQG